MKKIGDTITQGIQDMIDAFEKGVKEGTRIARERSLPHHCAACGVEIRKEDSTPQRFITYGKPDAWLCWSCNYDYKKVASRVETFYHLQKGE